MFIPALSFDFMCPRIIPAETPTFRESIKLKGYLEVLLLSRWGGIYTSWSLISEGFELLEGATLDVKVKM